MRACERGSEQSVTYFSGMKSENIYRNATRLGKLFIDIVDTKIGKTKLLQVYQPCLQCDGVVMVRTLWELNCDEGSHGNWTL
jgi:hypothetical protein